MLKHSKIINRMVALWIVVCFSLTSIISPAYSQTQIIPTPVLNLTPVGQMVPLSESFQPAMIKAINVYQDEPLKFDFVIDQGDTDFSDQEFQDESMKLVKYFLAALTVPEEDMWVNLSPYEKERIIPQAFGSTEMGRDLLAQDYMLKQLSSSLMHPDQELGQAFWDRVHKRVQSEFGDVDIPKNTFNKIWIVPEEALVYEHEKGAFVVKSYLKVMLEDDYLAMSHQSSAVSRQPLTVDNQKLTALMKELIIPEIEREVNEGKTFANLRQIYHSIILASWYKQALRDSLLGQVYVNQSKMDGIDLPDTNVNQKIYEQYVEAFKVGVYDFIKEDYDPVTQTVIPRKYFSGGVAVKKVAELVSNRLNKGQFFDSAQLANDGTQKTTFGKRQRPPKPSAVDALASAGFQNPRAVTIELDPAGGTTNGVSSNRSADGLQGRWENIELFDLNDWLATNATLDGIDAVSVEESNQTRDRLLGVLDLNPQIFLDGRAAYRFIRFELTQALNDMIANKRRSLTQEGFNAVVARLEEGWNTAKMGPLHGWFWEIMMQIEETIQVTGDTERSSTEKYTINSYPPGVLLKFQYLLRLPNLNINAYSLKALSNHLRGTLISHEPEFEGPLQDHDFGRVQRGEPFMIDFEMVYANSVITLHRFITQEQLYQNGGGTQQQREQWFGSNEYPIPLRIRYLSAIAAVINPEIYPSEDDRFSEQLREYAGYRNDLSQVLKMFPDQIIIDVLNEIEVLSTVDANGNIPWHQWGARPWMLTPSVRFGDRTGLMLNSSYTPNQFNKALNESSLTARSQSYNDTFLITLKEHQEAVAARSSLFDLQPWLAENATLRGVQAPEPAVARATVNRLLNQIDAMRGLNTGRLSNPEAMYRFMQAEFFGEFRSVVDDNRINLTQEGFAEVVEYLQRYWDETSLGTLDWWLWSVATTSLKSSNYAVGLKNLKRQGYEMPSSDEEYVYTMHVPVVLLKVQYLLSLSNRLNIASYASKFLSNHLRSSKENHASFVDPELVGHSFGQYLRPGNPYMVDYEMMRPALAATLHRFIEQEQLHQNRQGDQEARNRWVNRGGNDFALRFQYLASIASAIDGQIYPLENDPSGIREFVSYAEDPLEVLQMLPESYAKNILIEIYQLTRENRWRSKGVAEPWLTEIEEIVGNINAESALSNEFMPNRFKGAWRARQDAYPDFSERQQEYLETLERYLRAFGVDPESIPISDAAQLAQANQERFEEVQVPGLFNLGEWLEGNATLKGRKVKYASEEVASQTRDELIRYIDEHPEIFTDQEAAYQFMRFQLSEEFNQFVMRDQINLSQDGFRQVIERLEENWNEELMGPLHGWIWEVLMQNEMAEEISDVRNLRKKFKDFPNSTLNAYTPVLFLKIQYMLSLQNMNLNIYALKSLSNHLFDLKSHMVESEPLLEEGYAFGRVGPDQPFMIDYEMMHALHVSVMHQFFTNEYKYRNGYEEEESKLWFDSLGNPSPLRMKHFSVLTSVLNKRIYPAHLTQARFRPFRYYGLDPERAFKLFPSAFVNAMLNEIEQLSHQNGAQWLQRDMGRPWRMAPGVPIGSLKAGKQLSAAFEPSQFDQTWQEISSDYSPIDAQMLDTIRRYQAIYQGNDSAQLAQAYQAALAELFDLDEWLEENATLTGVAYASKEVADQTRDELMGYIDSHPEIFTDQEAAYEFIRFKFSEEFNLMMSRDQMNLSQEGFRQVIEHLEKNWDEEAMGPLYGWLWNVLLQIEFDETAPKPEIPGKEIRIYPNTNSFNAHTPILFLKVQYLLSLRNMDLNVYALKAVSNHLLHLFDEHQPENEPLLEEGYNFGRVKSGQPFMLDFELMNILHVVVLHQFFTLNPSGSVRGKHLAAITSALSKTIYPAAWHRKMYHPFIYYASDPERALKMFPSANISNLLAELEQLSRPIKSEELSHEGLTQWQEYYGIGRPWLSAYGARVGEKDGHGLFPKFNSGQFNEVWNEMKGLGFNNDILYDLIKYRKVYQGVDSAQLAQADQAQIAEDWKRGGIDMKDATGVLNVEQDGQGVQLFSPPAFSAQPFQANEVTGFIPVIIHITPVIQNNLPFILGLTPRDDTPSNQASNTTNRNELDTAWRRSLN